ncbi:hypothetical protein FQN57_005890 [Myotisia sp. PD_48]|nr:hypothetical protein FQN57_005890 [Myotisia sp. PD_48]
MRIPYTSNPPPTSNEEEAAVLQRVQARRGESGLLPLDLALLHSFPVSDGWNSFLGNIRTKTSIDADIRELAISRVAALNEAWFEWMHHAPMLQEAANFSDETLELIKKSELTGDEQTQLESQLNQKQLAVFKYTGAMTKTVKVSEEVFDELKALFNEKEVVEITATVAAYNCVSRFLVALDVGEMNR